MNLSRRRILFAAPAIILTPGLLMRVRPLRQEIARTFTEQEFICLLDEAWNDSEVYVRTPFDLYRENFAMGIYTAANPLMYTRLS